MNSIQYNKGSILSELKNFAFNIGSWKKFEELQKERRFIYSRKKLQVVEEELLSELDFLKIEGEFYHFCNLNFKTFFHFFQDMMEYFAMP